jgi:iron complex outermembrane receptor protein
VNRKQWWTRTARFVAWGLCGLSVGLAGLDAAQAQEVLEEVVVTGSRIRQDPLEERLPVLTLATEDIRLSGTSSLADFVQRLPISGSAINATNNSSGNLGFPPDGGGIGAGAAEIDLRYLTSKRVLVLVDGRRWIKGSSGSGVSGAVDLNTIPVNAVKTIEILQDGASAVYGSDAIGGVLNIITQDDYDSFKISGYTGQYQQGDGTTSEFDVRFGARGERTRGLIDISYTDQGSVNTADRDTSKYPIPGFPYGVSSGTPAGRFVFFDPVIGDFVSVAPDDGVAFPVWDPTDDPANGRYGDFHGFTLDDRFNYQPFNHLVTPNERVNIFAKAEYDVTDNVMFRVLGSFNNRKSQGQAAPVPLFFFPDGQSTTYMVNVSWPANHPYNPFGVDLDPSTGPFMARRPIEAGPRIFNQDVDTWYVSGGFDGEFELGGRPMYWDISGIRAENDATQIKLNQFNARNINIAMGDPDVCAVTPNCVPLNIVGAGSMTQEMLDYVTYTGVDRSNQKLTDFTANLSGELFNLPAGPLGFAVGFEYRKEEGFFTPDPVVAADETADVPTTPTVGSFDVNELYGEIVVPLLADLPLVDSLDLSAAVRFSDYNLFDSETVTKFAVNWGPTDSLVFRASFSEGFRAPNIGELFNQGSRFDASISDRCSNVEPADAANCAALGVPPDYEQLNPQIPVTTGGNAELVPETSDTVSVGFTWQVPVNGAAGMDDLLLEVNYYDIDIEGAIQAPRPQGLLDACITTLEDIYCDAITRLPSGTILRIDGVLDNIGGIETSGLDLNLMLLTRETGLGTFRFQWMTSFLLKYDELVQNSSGGFDRLDRKGRELGSPTRGFPETKSTLNTDWMYGDWSVRLGLRYMSSITEQCSGLVDDFGLTDLCSGTNELKAVFYADTQVSWRPSTFMGGGWTFTLGVNNLFDEEPPVCYSCSLNSLDGTLYPIAGQFWYARAIFER